MKAKKINLPFKAKKKILALGSQTKNTLCFAEGHFAYLSPVHPDLSQLADFLEFEKHAKVFLKKKPKIIACDLHPEYQSSKFAQALSPITYNLQPIQHHHAHIASCMLEHGLANQKVIGVAFDGTGLGLDNRIWGGEFLVCDYKDFRRGAHIKEIPLLGGEKAIQEPWRLAAAWLYQAYKDKFLNLRVDFVRGLDKNAWRVLKQMVLSQLHAPLASSAGRLFDAIASLVLNKHRARFEAELAIELEKLAEGCSLKPSAYSFELSRNKDEKILNPMPVFKQVVLDLKHKEPKEKIAYRFHLTVAQMIRKTCLLLRKENNLNKVILSGGVFQNKLLLRLSSGLLCLEGFQVLTHCQLPAHDAGISPGEVAIAHYRS